MTLYEFNGLEQACKSLYLADKGVIIGERVESTLGYTLFHVGSFYAEVCCDVEEGSLIRIRSLLIRGHWMSI